VIQTTHLFIMALQSYTSEKLTEHINRLTVEKGLSYLDAVIYFCEQRNIEPDIIAPLLSDRIKSELASDAQRLHFLPRTDSLQF
jgi:hypothetical protein